MLMGFQGHMACLFCFTSIPEVVKIDLTNLFEDWFSCDLEKFRLHFAMMTLIPKENDARENKIFRPSKQYLYD
jgi:hypothetical protein